MSYFKHYYVMILLRIIPLYRMCFYFILCSNKRVILNEIYSVLVMKVWRECNNYCFCFVIFKAWTLHMLFSRNNATEKIKILINKHDTTWNMLLNLMEGFIILIGIDIFYNKELPIFASLLVCTTKCWFSLLPQLPKSFRFHLLSLYNISIYSQ